MNREYVKLMVESFKNTFESMTDSKLRVLEIAKVESQPSPPKITSVIAYQDKDGLGHGEFKLGFSNQNDTILLASEIAQNMGLDKQTDFNEMVIDILNEFFNIFVGHAISQWDAKGFSVNFSTPTLYFDKATNSSDVALTIFHLITFELVSKSNKNCFNTQPFTLSISFANNHLTPTQPKRVLVVDDSLLIRNMCQKTLASTNLFHIETAKDGLEAIEKYINFKPDLVIMDLNMPNLGGLEAITQIRASNPEAKFVILTSSSRKNEVIEAKKLQIKNYLIKPIKPELLTLKVKESLEIPATT